MSLPKKIYSCHLTNYAFVMSLPLQYSRAFVVTLDSNCHWNCALQIYKKWKMCMLLTLPNFVLNVFRIHLAPTVAVIVLQDLLLVKSEQWLTWKAIENPKSFTLFASITSKSRSLCIEDKFCSSSTNSIFCMGIHWLICCSSETESCIFRTAVVLLFYIQW